VKLPRRSFLAAVAAGAVFAGLGCGPGDGPSKDAARSEAPAIVILARHAEKAGEEGDVPLTPEGEERARELSRMLKDTGVQHIFTSQYIRTKATAAPLAQATGITPVEIPADSEDALVQRLQQLPAGSVALVVSHSDRLPRIVAKFGAETPPIDHTEYDRIVMVTRDGGTAHALNFRYGK
jgi:phosphohistidine phosphatase SixA